VTIPAEGAETVFAPSCHATTGESLKMKQVSLDTRVEMLSLEAVSRAATSKEYRSKQVRHFLEESLKRDLDIVGSLALLFITAPIFLILAILVAADGGPVFFSHRRVGRNGVSFGCWKFRTMVVGAEDCLMEYLRYHPEARVEWDRAQKLAVDPRITPIGAFLRKTSLDEIPQLWNVLLGDMSLVGPRPVTESEMRDRYGSQATVVTSVRPGMTGAWQVTPDRNDVDYSRRVQLDASYVHGRNLATDITIILQTMFLVLARRGSGLR
jgi:lipopolysaccharide/colanic/teichoic acid biosynthesis glycosyltransferase